jgi:hypothetical protein
VTHEAEYHDNMVTMLELIWGKGYMAPGGPGNVAKLLDGTEPEGKLILDIGCGIGGPALDMVRHHSAQVPVCMSTAGSRASVPGHCLFPTLAST